MVPGGAEIDYIHTSGHVSRALLRAFAAAIRPKATVPVYSVKREESSYGFDRNFPHYRCRYDDNPLSPSDYPISYPTNMRLTRISTWWQSLWLLKYLKVKNRRGVSR